MLYNKYFSASDWQTYVAIADTCVITKVLVKS